MKRSSPGARVIASAVPYGTFPDALRTKETTALEPEVVDNKHFVKGVGEVTELSVTGPLEKLQLVEIIS